MGHCPLLNTNTIVSFGMPLINRGLYLLIGCMEILSLKLDL